MELFRADDTVHTGAVFVEALAAAVAIDDTSFTVTAGAGALLPALSGGDFIRLRVGVGSGYEVKKVTGRSGDVLTCDAFTQAFPANTPVIWTISGETLEDLAAPKPLPFPDTVPASPTAQDDEFDGTALDGKWTEGVEDKWHTASGYFVASTASSVNADWPSCFMVNVDNTLLAQQGLSIGQTLPGWTTGTAFSVTAKLRGRFYTDGGGMSVSILNSAGTAGVRASLERMSALGIDPGLATQIYGFQSGSWGDWSTNQLVSSAEAVFIHLQKDVSDVWHAWFSSDGFSWLDSDGFAPDVFTADQIVIAWFLDSETTHRRVGIDWVRFNWLTLP